MKDDLNSFLKNMKILTGNMNTGIVDAMEDESLTSSGIG
jgi:hypothetical protein